VTFLPVAESNPLQLSAQFLKGVGPARLESLLRLGLRTVEDVLFHFPRSYDDLSDIRPVQGITAGVLQTVQGEVVEIEGRNLADGRCLVSVVISDGKNCLEGVWFNQPYAARSLRFGQRLAFSGRPKWHRDHWQMSNPRLQNLDGPATDRQSSVAPIYPLAGELRADQLRAIVRQAVERFAGHVAEVLPAELRGRRSLADAPRALYQVHLPASLDEARAGRKRFLYEEFLILQLALALRRRELRDRQQAPVLPTTAAIDSRIRRLFPFRLTPDQDGTIAEIRQDLARDRPMQRLLQADVGAGKTVVAVYAMLVTVANKHQAVLMTPTEVLARQHWLTMERYLAHSRVRRLLLTGSLPARERRRALLALRAGEIDLVIGTQAVIQEHVQFARLGLVVIDEQHKFGVNQRAQLRWRGTDPHYLVMTATPIPRTVALTAFGDLDVSTIRHLPPGRQPVQTRWLPADRRDWLHEELRQQLRAGRQGYVICPLVESSDVRELSGAEQMHADLRAGPFRDFRLGLLHGQMPDREKDRVMEQFCDGRVQLLVSTTVVEVGVDVPNATLMVIEHAERFGLSQLHQLRGRISRGRIPGQCYLFADPVSDDARERLRLLTRTTDGFALAEHDARLRGVGEFFGTRQHGQGELNLGDVVANFDLLKLARKDAFDLVAADAGLRQPEHALLRQAVLDRYGQALNLAEIG
jgi:ATP-dependent DNA helicase RecG